MVKVSESNRNDPDFAQKIIEECCPSPKDRELVLRQLLKSISIAELTAPASVWALTLFPKGFRLNVGAVEVMTFLNGDLRLLIFGEISEELIQFYKEHDEDFFIEPINYKSVPSPQHVFLWPACGSTDEGEEVRRTLEMILAGLSSQHAEFVRYATLSPNGKPRQSCNFSKSNSSGLYEYAKAFCSKGHGSKKEQPEIRHNDASEQLSEGSSYTVLSDRFERNQAARKACIAHYGTTCSICGFNFEDTYGATAKEFIHVHHLTPLASIGENYIVDPVKDLRPVCPNCHSVIHMRNPPYSVDDVRKLISQVRKQK